jgi:hypothetical protein
MSDQDDEYHLDTNAIIELNRTESWNAVAHNLDLHTVEEVVRECGEQSEDARNYVPVDIEQLKKDCTVHQVTDSDLAMLRLQLAGRVVLDPGEEHLLANALIRQERWAVVSPDKALIRAVNTVASIDRVISVEEMHALIGHKSRHQLRNQFTKSWLSSFRTRLLLDTI